MRVLIVGGEGMIGRVLAERFRSRGHEVVVTSRRAAAGEGRLDLAALPSCEALIGMLQGYDLLVNAAGIGPSRRAHDHETVHRLGACRLFDACVAAGVPRILQISALGDPGTGSFIASKHAADEYLFGLPVDALVIRPSLVFSRQGETSRLLLSQAHMPVLVLAGIGDATIQPIHVDDLADALVPMIEKSKGPRGMVEVVGPRALSLADFVLGLRVTMGRGRTWRVPLPYWLSKPGFIVLGWLGFSAGGLQTLRVLRAGSVGMPGAICTGRDPACMLTAIEAREERSRFARSMAVWSGRLALSIVCLASALIPLVAAGHARSLEWLARFGLQDGPARAVFAVLIGVDLLCACAALTARTVKAWLAVAAVVATYTLVMSVRLPELWLNPFGPLLKNLPMIAWAVALAGFSDAEKGSES
ncbi:MAG TPA: SDR family oxidoreductase [Rhodocyclaceae bacterium]|nr:SDR family oxidoreductase [Rhodocyclaceae bacterium]